jgi:hypothetical protein
MLVNRKKLRSALIATTSATRALLRRGLDWQKAAEQFAAAGLRGARGRLLDASTAEATWRRVNQRSH